MGYDWGMIYAKTRLLGTPSTYPVIFNLELVLPY